MPSNLDLLDILPQSLGVQGPLMSVVKLPSELVIEGLLSLVQAQEPILDPTYGNGTFWKGTKRKVVGGDCDPTRAKDIVLDFTALPFTDGQFPTVVFDPPFHPDVNSRESVRFKHMGSDEKQMQAQFRAGVAECWRVCSHILIVKCQGFIHNHRPQWMPLWAIDVCGEPFEWLVVMRDQKVISGRWTSCNSLRRNHADYLVFNRGGNHR